MSRADPSPAPGRLLLGLVLALAAATACATAAPAQTPLMRAGGAAVSAQAMRLRLRALAPQLIAGVEIAANDIRTGTSDPVIERRAIVWKLSTTTALYRQLFSEEPAAGLLDCWAMLIQGEQFLSRLEAEHDLGSAPSQALGQVEKMEQRVEETFHWAVPGRDLAKVRAELVRWATAHPLEGNLAARRSLLEDLASRTASPELSAFESVGVVADDVEGIVARMDFLPVILPKQSIWEAELAYQDFGQRQVDEMMKRANLALGGVDRMVAFFGGTTLDAFADRQRTAIIAAVDRERLALSDLADTERGKFGELIARERVAVLEELRKERVAATADVRQVATDSIAGASLAAKDVVDYLLLRLALLVAGAILLWGVVATVVRRRLEHRHASEIAGTSGNPIDVGVSRR